MKYQIRIAFEELIRERNSGGNILLETISLLLVGIILFIGAINDYNQIVVQSALKGNLKNTGIVTITDNNQYKPYDTEEGYHEFANTSLHKYNLFMYELNNSSCIENPLSCLILHVSMQSVHIIENFGNYGILYANGFSLTDHILIFLIQNFLKGVAAVFLTLGAGYQALDLFFSDSLSIYSFHVLYTVILKYVLWKVFLCAIAIMVLTTLVSSVLFCKKTPSVLLKENK